MDWPFERAAFIFSWPLAPSIADNVVRSWNSTNLLSAQAKSKAWEDFIFRSLVPASADGAATG